MVIADKEDGVIRSLSDGSVSTIAGTGAQGMVNGDASGATFTDPAGVAFDAKGFIYVSDLGNNAIRSISTDGQVTTLAGTGNNVGGYKDGDGSQAQFNNPEGIVVDATGAIYVADLANNCIRKITIQVVN